MFPRHIAKNVSRENRQCSLPAEKINDKKKLQLLQNRARLYRRVMADTEGDFRKNFPSSKYTYSRVAGLYECGNVVSERSIMNETLYV